MAEQSVECIELQLCEMELLSSMFPRENELEVDDLTVLDEMKDYISGKRSAPPRQLAFTINQKLDRIESTIGMGQILVKMRCLHPLQYPFVLPKLYVSCDQASRKEQKELNENLDQFLSNQPTGELCISAILQWIQDSVPSMLYRRVEEESKSEKRAKNHHSMVSRLWIYSHHIYRKELLKKIPECAKELSLTGFCLPGKPGIICVEGFGELCDEFWHRLRYPNWKHICCKHREDRQLSENDSEEEMLTNFRLFSSFSELVFEAHGDYGLRNDYHMDLGQFRQYLQDYGCQEIFKILFGFEAKTHDASKKGTQ